MDACSTMDLSIRHAPRRQEMDEREHAPHAPHLRASDLRRFMQRSRALISIHRFQRRSVSPRIALAYLELDGKGKDGEASEVKCPGCHDERGPRDEKRTEPNPTHLHTNSTHSFLPNFPSRSVARFLTLSSFSTFDVDDFDQRFSRPCEPASALKKRTGDLLQKDSLWDLVV